MDVPCTGTTNCYKPSGTYGVLSTSNSAYDKAYGTTTGWDFATGIGTVNAYNLIMDWPKFIVKTSPTGLSFSIDGTTYTSTQTPKWILTRRTSSRPRPRKPGP
jgi:hypothetical protein